MIEDNPGCSGQGPVSQRWLGLSVLEAVRS
jgi:hypothetical protein